MARFRFLNETERVFKAFTAAYGYFTERKMHSGKSDPMRENSLLFGLTQQVKTSVDPFSEQ